MKKFTIISFIVLTISTISNASAESFFPSPLISADWLSENGTDEVVILDVRKELDSFIKVGHIENAILVNDKKVRVNKILDGKSLTRMRPTAKEFEAYMQQHGVNNDSHVVITHQGKTPGQVAGAARLYWHLKTFNFEHVALLDGGNAAWTAALEDLSKEPTNTKKGNYKITSEDTRTVATMAEVKEAINDDNTLLIDSRSLRQHIGADKKDYVYAYGHLPNSKIMYYKLLNPLKGTAKYEPKEKINAMLSALNIDPKLNKIIYCNSAYEASSVWFVLHELLGFKNTQIYDGSLHQWTKYPENPIVKTLSYQ